MELKNIVYITVNTLNGHFYIGVHKTNPETFDGYIGCGIYSQSGAVEKFNFHKAVKKYGYKNFKRTTIAVFPDSEEGRKQALNLEAQIVNSTLLKSKECYNMVLGGGGGEKESCNKKVYMFSLNGNYLRSFKNIRSAAFYVVEKFPKYTVENIRSCIKNVCRGASQSCCGYYFNYIKKFEYQPSLKKQVVAQYTVSGKFIRKWDSITEARNCFKCDVRQALDKNIVAGGYIWKKYTTDNDTSPVINQRSKFYLKPIIMYNDTFKTEYVSINECVKQNPDLNKNQIIRVLNKKIKTHKKYHFSYKDEDIV